MAKYEITLEEIPSTFNKTYKQEDPDKEASEPSSLQSQGLTTTRGTKELSSAEKPEAAKDLQPTTDTAFQGSDASSYSKAKSDGELSQKSRRHTRQRKVGSSSDKRSTSTSRRGARLSRSSSYGRLLTAPKSFGGRPVRRLPRCLWSLLSISLSPPDVPVIVVTNPEGEIKYPFDHNYYGDSDSEEKEESSSDGWEDMDGTGMKDQATCRF
ncbi:uncharacterized protein GGS22DRAFT_195497 [Annulohypoxylon maeteangense]|uniref:uncharacterized protein n=1 Tax=Annulohypoxylon maeteangense TaxID=1927788 RepID=UPI0020085AA5|nr:uncharacterized protein GGS22DRAFT_195497 [Annulohypoxylon maeteangense]KAI0882704.1 hypothetical protein GGS22DRAFT_195497 [Annulohypoxylon maeteangense]